jgi:hypothetical protein
MCCCVCSKAIKFNWKSTNENISRYQGNHLKCSFIELLTFPYTVFKLRKLFVNCVIFANVYGKFKMTVAWYILLALLRFNIESYLRIWRTFCRISKSYVKRKTFVFLLYLIMNCRIEDKMAFLLNKIWQYNRDRFLT